MSENFVFSSFKKPNRVTKNAAVVLNYTAKFEYSRENGFVRRGTE